MKLFRAKKEEEAVRQEIAVKETAPFEGLTEAEAVARAAAGWDNRPVEPPTRTTGQIVRENLLTYFNLVFLVLALCLVAVKASILNLSFIIVVIINAVIGIVQELRSKKALDALNILTAPQCAVVREGREKRVDVSALVRDDIVLFSSGEQVCADAVVVDGTCLVNEALVTGEADEIRKAPGDTLLSGSFLVSGMCRARLTAVGADSFVSRLTLDAKAQKKRQAKGMMKALSDLVKWIGIGIIPMGVLLVVKEVHWLGRSIPAGVTSTVGALVGMIPEGVYLLTSLALVAGVLRLAQKKTMCREMDCIETLARVDTLCVDKTGTVTENKMIVDDIVPLCPDRFIAEDIHMIMADYCAAMRGDNDTMAAMRKFFTGEVNQRAIAALPFTSAKKYGGVSFHEDETYLLGAPEVILGGDFDAYREKIDHYSAKGCRVLLLALYDGQLTDEALTAERLPISLILLSNKIRAEAPDTFAWFAREGVSVRVISGDNPLTVSEVARRAGIPDADRAVDARTLETDEQVEKAARECVVFGRVTPEMKRRLVLALKKQGHTVAMTGDGVNDVLALKDANCGIAMASGSQAASQVAQIVLTDSQFSAMPSIVAEGRRVINNIQRAASLFLVKNIFSLVFTLVLLFVGFPFPLQAIQMSLISALTIGIPSFFLALEPNYAKVSGRFLRNVIRKAMPGGLTNIILVLLAAFLSDMFKCPEDLSTMAMWIVASVGFMTLFYVSQPFTKLRVAVFAAMLALMIGALTVMPSFFEVQAIHTPCLLTLIILILACPTLMYFFRLIFDNQMRRHDLRMAAKELRPKRRRRSK